MYSAICTLLLTHLSMTDVIVTAPSSAAAPAAGLSVNAPLQPHGSPAGQLPPAGSDAIVTLF